jgi:CHAD domain-containing protein
MDQSNFSLHRHEPLRDGFLRIVDELTDSVSENLADPARNGEPDIHGIRTTIKRLRALLRLIRPAIGPAFFNRENARLRAAAALLSLARDTEVACQTLKTLPVSAERDRDAVQTVLAGFESRVQIPVDLDDNLAQVKQSVEQTRRNLHRLRFRLPERDLLAAGLGTVYRQGRKRMEAAIELGQDNAFHRWRIRAKNLYYELEFLKAIWPGRFHRLVSRLSKLQDEIGLDHDAAVLRAWLKKTPEDFGDSETVERVIGCLDSKIQELRERSVPLGRRIWREKPRRFTRQVVRRWRKR